MIEPNRAVGGDLYVDHLGKRGMRLLTSAVGILLLAYVISMIVVRMEPSYVLLAGLVVIGAIVLSRKFELGLLAYVLIAPLQPSRGAGMRGSNIDLGAGIVPLLILAFLIVFWVAREAILGRLTLERTRLNGPIAAFFTVAFASLIAAELFRHQSVSEYKFGAFVNLAEIALWMLSAAGFLLMANASRDRGWLTAFYWPVTAVALYYSLFQMIGRAETMPIAVPRGAFIVAFAAVLSLSRAILGQSSANARAGYAFLTLLFLANTVWDPGWVSGWLAAGLGAAFVVLTYSRKLFLPAAAIAFLALFVYPGYFNAIYDQSRQEGDMDRAIIWVDAGRMAISQNPLLGIGPGNYRTYNRVFSSVWYGNRTYTSAHSDYAQMVAEMGIIGSAAFLWLIVGGVLTGLQSSKRSKPEDRWFAVGATAIFASIAITSLVGDYLLPSRINGGITSFGSSVIPWVMLGASVAVARSAEIEEDAQ